jgi:hypothetical protein
MTRQMFSIGSDKPDFIDVAHLNEASSRRLAERLTEIAAPRVPRAAIDLSRAH